MSEEAREQAAAGDVQNRLDELAAELKAVSTSVSRHGRVAAWILIVVCAIVAIYLGVLYKQVTPRVQPETLVQYAADQIPQNEDALIEQLKASVPQVVDRIGTEMEKLKADIPARADKLAEQLIQRIPSMLDQLEPQMQQLKATAQQRREEIAKKLKDVEPEAMDKLKDQLAALKPKIPELTSKFTQTLVKQAPAIADKLCETLIKTMPSARKMVLSRVKEQLAASTERLDDVVDKAVKQVVEQHKKDIATLSVDDLSTRLQAAFEEAAGPVLDEVAAPVGRAIVGVRTDLAELINKARTDPSKLTREEQLELRLIQLANTYFRLRAARPAE